MWVVVVESESWIKLSFKTQFHIRELSLCCCSFDKLCLTLLTPWTATCQASLSSLSPKVCSNSCSLSQWCHPAIIPFSSCPQSFPASWSFPVTQLFTLGDQIIGGDSAATSVLPMNMQGWFPLGLTGLILLSKELSRAFSSTTIQKHQFFSAQPSLWYNSHICTWHLNSLK